nr:proline-rich receptor-like protein kinase PERK2 [Lolium perenne]
MEEETEEGDASRKAGTTAMEWPTLPPCSTPEEDGTVAMPTPTSPTTGPRPSCSLLPAVPPTANPTAATARPANRAWPAPAPPCCKQLAGARPAVPPRRPHAHAWPPARPTTRSPPPTLAARPCSIASAHQRISARIDPFTPRQPARAATTARLSSAPASGRSRPTHGHHPRSTKRAQQAHAKPPATLHPALQILGWPRTRRSHQFLPARPPQSLARRINCSPQRLGLNNCSHLRAPVNLQSIARCSVSIRFDFAQNSSDRTTSRINFL